MSLEIITIQMSQYGLRGAKGDQGDPGVVQSVSGGTNISVDSTDPADPIVSLSLGADENFTTDEEKTKLSNLSGTNTGDQIIPDKLSDLSEDTNHRIVTDTEKSTWNGKQNALGFTPENSANKGVSGGYAELDVTGKVPSTQLPSYVDDVIEATNYAALVLLSGESGKIYITLDDGKTYRWSGSSYVEISASLALGETSGTAYRGDRGKTAYEHSQTSGNPHGAMYYDVGAAPALGTDDNYVTDAEKIVIGNTSGTNTGDQDLSGLVVKSGSLNQLTTRSHADLQNFTADDHSQYALLAGRTGGQTLVGGSGVTDILNLQGTAGNGTLTSPAFQLKVGNNGAKTAMTVLNNGYMGIGTTTPTAKLQFKGAGTGTGYNFQTLNSAGTALVTGFDNGLVGIGTTTPDYLLHIYGDGTKTGLKIENPTESGYSLLRLAGDQATSGAYFIHYGSTATTYANQFALKNVDGPITFYPSSASVEMVRFTDNGLSIGTTESSARLQIKGAGTTTGLGLLVTNSAGTARLTVRDDGAFAFKGGTVGVAQTGYTTFGNLSTDRTCDANSTTVEELADILGTLIEDLKIKGLIAT